MNTEDNKILRMIYTFFLGLLLAIFVGVGISTFYEAPARPEYPIEAQTYGGEPTEEQINLEREFEQTNIAFDENEMQPYNRNVSIMVITAAVILLALSIVFEKKIKVIADGVMLGGLFTLFYGIGRGFASANTKYVFVVVTISLVAVLYLGYHRFVEKQIPAKVSKSKS